MAPEVIALLSALLAGVGVEVARKFLSRKEVVFDQNLKLIQEFRDQIKELQDRQDTLEKQLDEWKCKYYDLKAERDALAVDLRNLKIEVEKLRAQVAQKG